mmetsp:Transcript_11607/g.19752  ORF Transcript_11607/g.19752 Transcript_11607/m.19752 type:complete len:126 (+) Transcript_11607:1071-1448(+)
MSQSKPVSKTSTASLSKISEEEDLAVAAKEKGQINASSKGRRTPTPTRKRSSANQDDEAAMDRPGKKTAKQGAMKKKRYCNSEGCTNQVVQGGVCTKHGAKRKLCSSEGCTNQATRRGLCRRHGA